jgi:hypothetical protein
MTKADQQRYLNAAMVPAADIHKRPIDRYEPLMRTANLLP